MKLRVLYHGHCFDGVASAATFTRFYQERIHPDAEVQYAGLLHRPGNLLFEGNMIDGALYESAAQCVELKEPPLQLMQVIEADPDEGFVEQIIRDLTVQPLNEVATSEQVQRRFEPILKQHRETLEAIRRKAIYSDGVIHFDLIDEGYEGFNKFIPYYLFPEATYSVALTRAPQRTKISVGSNPWAPRPRRHNIASLCERYGGGGHAVVGAISFAPDEVEAARAALREIVAELKTG